jgi:hypothetical protein
MIRGNETAIDLGLELLVRLNRGRALRARSLEEIVVCVQTAREWLVRVGRIKPSIPPVTRQDICFLEHRALQRMRKAELELAVAGESESEALPFDPSKVYAPVHQRAKRNGSNVTAA